MSKFLVNPADESARFHLVADEAAVLLNLVEHLLELLGEGGFSHHFDPSDPFAQLMGLGQEVTAPEDPVLRRLLPNAYADPEAADEYRRFTEVNLRRIKLSGAEQVRAALTPVVDEGLDEAVIDSVAAAVWLKVINDLRLALGVRLEIGADSYETYELMAPNDDQKPVFAVYFWLGWLQEELLESLNAK
jgi:hypothetical protein